MSYSLVDKPGGNSVKYPPLILTETALASRLWLLRPAFWLCAGWTISWSAGRGVWLDRRQPVSGLRMPHCVVFVLLSAARALLCQNSADLATREDSFTVRSTRAVSQNCQILYPTTLVNRVVFSRQTTWWYKKLSYRREAVRCLVLLSIFVSRWRLL